MYLSFVPRTQRNEGDVLIRRGQQHLRFDPSLPALAALPPRPRRRHHLARYRLPPPPSPAADGPPPRARVRVTAASRTTPSSPTRCPRRRYQPNRRCKSHTRRGRRRQPRASGSRTLPIRPRPRRPSRGRRDGSRTPPSPPAGRVPRRTRGCSARATRSRRPGLSTSSRRRRRGGRTRRSGRPPSKERRGRSRPSR